MPYPKANSKKSFVVKEKDSMYIKNKSDVQQEFVMSTQQTIYGLSSLRANLFQIVDAALQSGEPVPLERNGQRLWLVPECQTSRIDRLPILDITVGNPDDLVNLNVSEWNETKNLD